MRKLVLILLVLLAVVTYIRALTDTDGKMVPSTVELNKPVNG